jgi:thiamine biosynthesis lipoprotein
MASVFIGHLKFAICHLPFGILFLLTSILLVSSPQGTAVGSPVRYEASHSAMGTVYTVAGYGADADFLAATVDEIFEEVDRLDAQISNYKPESELSRINRDAAQKDVLVEPHLFGLIQLCQRLSEDTQGAFDITVGPLMKSWGFFRGQGRVPSPQEIRDVLRHVGYRHVHLDAERRTVHFDKPGIELDLGAKAKGYAVDRAADILKENGVSSALVSAGTSSIYALGAPPGERGWKINLRDPFDGSKAAEVIYLNNFSLSTSGSYERFFKLGGKEYGHIMDPHTGRPAEHMLSTATFTEHTVDSDGLSTALYVLGVEASRNYLAQHPNIAAIFYLPAGAEHTFRRVSLQSPSYHLPPDALVEIRNPAAPVIPVPNGMLSGNRLRTSTAK